MPLLPCAILLCLLLTAVPFNKSFATAASFSSPSPSNDLHRQCPTNCLCSIVGRHIQVDCSYASISNFPAVLPTNISQLYLSGNPIEHISRSDLQNSQPHLHYLEDLQCSDCQLTELETGTFRGFQKLKYIDLSDNDINVISPDLFAALPSLRLVNVKSNRRLDCTAMVAAFKVKLPHVQVRCGDETAPVTTTTTTVMIRKRRNDSTDNDKLADQDPTTVATLAADASIKATDSDAPIGIQDGSSDGPVSNGKTEPESGFGVGTIIVLTLLSVIISIVCFKFVFLRLKKRFFRGDRHSEEQPLDSD